jgi:hypothetical protein
MAANQTMKQKDEDPFLDCLVGFVCGSQKHTNFIFWRCLV